MKGSINMNLFKIVLIIGLPIIVLASQPVGLVKSVQGDVLSIKDDKTSITLKVGDNIYEKDTIKTAVGGLVGIIFEDNTVISIGSNSEFSIDEYFFEPNKKKVNFASNLAKGSMSCITGLIAKINPNAMKIKAKSASIGIRGTYFIVEVDE